MSRAFIREDDVSGELLPERPVSSHPNYVTARGWQLIEEEITRLELAADAARKAKDDSALARLERDLRYWLQRRATARVVEIPSSPDRVLFGVRVLLRDEQGVELRFRLVGEDEADPAAGLISWASPLAQQLLDREIGDEIQWRSRRLQIVALGREPD